SSTGPTRPPTTSSSWTTRPYRFIDQLGYDTAYTTDVDVDADPAQLVGHRLVVVPGHSEYWTKAMRDGFEAARGLGVNLAFRAATPRTGRSATPTPSDACARSTARARRTRRRTRARRRSAGGTRR